MPERVMVVQMRHQRQRQAEQQEEDEALDADSLVTLSPVDEDADSEQDPDGEEAEAPEEDPTNPFQFADVLFLPAKERTKQSRSQKRRVRAADEASHPLDGGAEILRAAQQEDPTLQVIREQGDEPYSNFVTEQGLLYRKWQPHKNDEPIQQLVLPQNYCNTTLKMAHAILLAGHLGRKKTTDRVLQRFYWPGLYSDVQEMCRGCPKCQHTAKHQRNRPLLCLYLWWPNHSTRLRWIWWDPC